MREPTRRLPVGVPGWNDRAAVALLVVVAEHLLVVEAGPLTPDRLARFVAAYQDDLPALVAALEDSPSASVPSNCAASSAPARPWSTCASCRASPSPSPTPSSASPWPAPLPAPVSTSSRRPVWAGKRARS